MLSTRNALVVSRPRRSAQADGCAIVRRFLAWAQQSGAGDEGRSGKRARARLSPFQPPPPAQGRSGGGDDHDDRRPLRRRAPRAGGGGLRRARRAAPSRRRTGERRGAGRRAGARPLSAADRRRTRRLRRDGRRRGAVRDRAPARPRRGAGRGAGRSRPARSGAGAHRQSDGRPLRRGRCAGCSPGSATTRKFGKPCSPDPACLRASRSIWRLRRRRRSPGFVGSTGWLDGKRAEKIAREARDAALVTIAADCEPHGTRRARADAARTRRADHGAHLCGRCSRASATSPRRRSRSFPACLSRGPRPLPAIPTARVSRRSRSRPVCRAMLCPRSARRSAPSKSTARETARRIEAAARRGDDRRLRGRARSGARPDPVASVAASPRRRRGRRREQSSARRPPGPPCRRSSTLRPPTTTLLRWRPPRRGPIRTLPAPAVEAGGSRPSKEPPPPLEIPQDLIRALDAA